MTDETIPTDRARELVRGAYDLHVHVGPDVVGRRIDDLGLAARCRAVGLAGFALKSHYTATAERAAGGQRARSRACARSGRSRSTAAVGGINPLAVEIAAREAARIVWMPTVDSVNETSERRSRVSARFPRCRCGCASSRSSASTGVEGEPVPVVDGDGQPLPALAGVLEVIARHGLVLATGHLGRDEIFAVVDAALAAGVRDVVVTHPEFPSQNLSLGDQAALAERGALLERCFTTAHTGKCPWERVVDGIRAPGAARNLLSSDLGQPANLPVEDGLALFADRLLAAGLTDEEIHTMTVLNSGRLAG